MRKLILIKALVLFSSMAFAFGEGGMMGKGSGGGMMGKKKPEIMGAFFPMRANLDDMQKKGFVETGLKPIYPEKYNCPKVQSFFASPYRSDGSERSSRFFQGLHGGMDIPQPKGTPLIAMADGEIIVKHVGSKGGIGGLGLWVRHSPKDTGLDKWIFIEYKHIDKLPDLEVGESVKMGQVIAETGNTGTDKGGYYGYEGFYHLHMTAYWSDTEDYKHRRVLFPIEGEWLDPLAMLRGKELGSSDLKELSGEEKIFKIPFKTTDGKFFPQTTKVVWPYMCKAK